MLPGMATLPKPEKIVDIEPVGMGEPTPLDAERDRSLGHVAGEAAATAMLAAIGVGARLVTASARFAIRSRPGQFVVGAAGGALSAVNEELGKRATKADDTGDTPVGKVVTIVLDAVDVSEIVRRIDINEILAQIDIDAMLENVDVEELAKRVKVGNLMVDGTGEMATSALDLGRRQIVGLDTIVMRLVDRILGRDSASTPLGPKNLV